jgi:hypothetical protein
LADNTQVTAGSGDVIRDIDRGTSKTQVVVLDVGGAASESLVTTTNPVPISVNAANFIFSSVNSSTVQLAAGATFTGTVEDLRSQPAISILLTSDQPGILKIFQYTDASGLVLDQTWTINTAASPAQQTALSRTINANYIKVSWQNAGGGTTTTLNLNTAYGTIPAATNLGNGPVSIEEIGGVAVSGSLPVTLGSATLSTRDVALQNALTNDQPIGTFLTGDPNGNYPGVNLLESMLDGDLQLPVTTDLVKGGSNKGLQMADMAGPYFGSGSAVGIIGVIDTLGYNTFSVQFQGGVATTGIEISNDGANWYTQPIGYFNSAGTGSTTSTTINISLSVAAPVFVAVTCAYARYLRIRIISYTSGTPYYIGYLRTAVTPVNIATQPVSGTVNSQGAVAEDAAQGTNPVLVGGVVRTGLIPATIVNGDAVRATFGTSGALVVDNHAVPELTWNYAPPTGGLTNTTTAVTIKAAVASQRGNISSIQLSHSPLGAATEFAIRDGAAGTVLWRHTIPLTTAEGLFSVVFDPPIRQAAVNTLLEIVTLTASVTGAVYFNAQGFMSN